MDRAVPPLRPGTLAPRQRDEGLLRIRKLTLGAVVAAVGGVVVMAGYVAQAVPGHHVSRAPGAATSPAITPTTAAQAPSSSTGPASSPSLAPPSAPPQYSGNAAQVISGSS